MSFSWPWALLSLLIVPIVAGVIWLLRRRRRRAAVRVTSIALVRAAMTGRTRWTRLIPTLLLVLGLVNMMRGGSPNTSQKLMRWRVGLQFFAILVVMIVLYFRG